MYMSDLPSHLMVLILQKLGTEKNYRNAAHMRLVSKDWRAAFADCPGYASLVLLHKADMARMLALAPSMSQLHIQTRGKPVCFPALVDCARLESVTVFGNSLGPPLEFSSVDLRGLPRNVSQLAFMFDVYLVPESFSSLARLNIKSLRLGAVSNSLVDINQLLEHVPKLEVSYFQKPKQIFMLFFIDYADLPSYRLQHLCLTVLACRICLLQEMTLATSLRTSTSSLTGELFSCFLTHAVSMSGLYSFPNFASYRPKLQPIPRALQARS